MFKMHYILKNEELRNGFLFIIVRPAKLEHLVSVRPLHKMALTSRGKVSFYRMDVQFFCVIKCYYLKHTSQVFFLYNLVTF
jgi:hypothetical protein